MDEILTLFDKKKKLLPPLKKIPLAPLEGMISSLLCSFEGKGSLAALGKTL